jgi:glycosyltransferase involved in cell wall biosynthesis
VTTVDTTCSTGVAPGPRSDRVARQPQTHPTRREGPIRVVFCIDNMDIGGTELNAVRTAERLDPSRFALSIVSLCDHGPLLARYRERGIPVLCLPLHRLHGSHAMRQAVRLVRFLTRQRVDIVHSHDVYNNVFSTMCARLSRRSVVIASRRWLDEVPRPSLRTANRVAYRFADCVLTNSESIAELLVARDRVQESRVAVVPNFVDDQAFVPPPPDERARFLFELGVPPGSFVVGCVASLRPVKNHELLLRAVANLRSRWPSMHLVLVGDGDSRPSLEALARQLGLAGVVHFAGLRPNEPNLHHLFDLSVLSSRSEALPNSLVEAMAAGRPVVATRVGGVADVVRDGETGLLAPAGDVDAFGRAIESLLRDPERRFKYGAAARERAETTFQARRVIPMLESLYATLLHERVR